MTNRRALRVALASCADHPGFVAGGNEALVARLRELDIHAELAVWTDPAVDWSAYDATLIRTTWDYTSRLAEFRSWMRHVEAVGQLFNPSRLCEPNLEKEYLRRLGDAAVPTVWLRAAADDAAVESALDEAARRGWETLAVKPTVAAAAEGLLVAPVSERAKLRMHIRKIGRDRGVMVQPLIETIRTRGELSVVLIEGEPSHAVRKTPTDGELRCQIEYGGAYEVESPGAAALGAVERASVLWRDEPSPPLYARVDLLEPEADLYKIIEVELVEPELFFRWSPAGARRFGEALRRRLAGTR